jgi:hypothetical protein
MQVKCGPGRASVDPARSVTLSGTSAGASGTIGISVDAVAPKGATNHIYSNMLPFGKTNRTLVFISQPPGSNQFEVRRIAEDAAMIPQSSPAAKRRQKSQLQ